MSIFSMDSKLMQALSRISDLILLNILFLVTCIPILTIGAASTAMYSVAFRLGTREEQGVFLCYFRSFLKNFKQSTAIFLLLALPTAFLCYDFFFFFVNGGIPHYLAYLCVPLLMALVLIYGYAFPLLSQFHNTVITTIKNGLFLSIGYLPRSLIVAVMNCLPLFILLFNPLLFLKVSIVWLLVYFAGAAYINALILRKIFAPYQISEEETP